MSASAIPIPVADADGASPRARHRAHRHHGVRQGTGLTAVQRERVFTEFTAWEDEKGWP